MMHDHLLFRVLVIEDEFFIAEDLARALKQEGFAIVGPVANRAAASAVLDREHVDFAVIDLNLTGDLSFEMAAELQARGVPFLFLTGYDQSVVPLEFAAKPFLQKPHDHGELIARIRQQRPVT